MQLIHIQLLFSQKSVQWISQTQFILLQGVIIDTSISMFMCDMMIDQTHVDSGRIVNIYIDYQKKISNVTLACFLLFSLPIFSIVSLYYLTP